MAPLHPGARVQVVFGGTNAKTDVRRFDSALPSVLVATPGRLLDHLQNTRLAGGRGSFSDALGMGGKTCIKIRRKIEICISAQITGM